MGGRGGSFWGRAVYTILYAFGVSENSGKVLGRRARSLLKDLGVGLVSS